MKYQVCITCNLSTEQANALMALDCPIYNAEIEIEAESFDATEQKLLYEDEYIKKDRLLAFCTLDLLFVDEARNTRKIFVSRK